MFTVIIWLDTGVLLRIYPRLFFTGIILTEYIGYTGRDEMSGKMKVVYMDYSV